MPNTVRRPDDDRRRREAQRRRQREEAERQAAAAAAEAARKAREEEERKAAEAARKTQEEAAKAMARQQTQNAQQAQQKNDKVQGSSQGQSSSSFGSNTTAKPQTVSNGQAVVNYAAQFVGNPYVWGGSSPATSFDCSGKSLCLWWQQPDKRSGLFRICDERISGVWNQSAPFFKCTAQCWIWCQLRRDTAWRYRMLQRTCGNLCRK